MGSDQAPHLPTCPYNFHESKCMTKVKKSDLIEARILWYIFRLIDNLNSIIDDEEIEISYCSIYPKKLDLAKENTDKDVASFVDLDIKI